MQVGIPRGLLYYKYYPFWKTFLDRIGCSVISSPKTTRPILSKGLSIAESEICLPVKAFYGHADYLKDKVDALFIPRMVAVEGNAYTCPKLLGLPDMIKSAVGAEILAPEINLKKGMRGYYVPLLELAKKLGVSLFSGIKAIYSAEKTLSDFNNQLYSGKTINELLNNEAKDSSKGDVRIGVAGHPYNTFDNYLSLGLIRKLKNQGADVVTPENVPPRIWNRYAKRLPKYLFWTYERELLGSAIYWIDKGQVDGLIYALSFACGPDSIVQYILEDEARKYETPIMPLMLDEHSAEAGVMTRIEAFLDMIRRSKNS